MLVLANVIVDWKKKSIKATRETLLNVQFRASCNLVIGSLCVSLARCKLWRLNVVRAWSQFTTAAGNVTESPVDRDVL